MNVKPLKQCFKQGILYCVYNDSLGSEDLCDEIGSCTETEETCKLIFIFLLVYKYSLVTAYNFLAKELI